MSEDNVIPAKAGSPWGIDARNRGTCVSGATRLTRTAA